jgi:hypothetical protein
LVQYNSDGTLKLIGRVDTGQRIELDAAENFIREYASSSLKVVVVEVPVPHFSRLTSGNYQMQICFPEAVYNNLQVT